MDRTESTEQHPNDGQVIITSSHMQTGISCLQTETKLWACNRSKKASTCHVQGWNNPIKPKRAVSATHRHWTAMLSSLRYKIYYHGWEGLARAGVRQGGGANSLTTDGKYWNYNMLAYCTTKSDLHFYIKPVLLNCKPMWFGNSTQCRT